MVRQSTTALAAETQQPTSLPEFVGAEILRAADPLSLHDSAVEADSDRLEADGGQTRLSRDILSYACWLFDLDSMNPRSSSSSDTKGVAEAVDFLLTKR